MSETKSFGILAAELEGDAPVGAGALRSTYASRMAPGRVREALAHRFDQELDEVLEQLRTSLHEAWASSVSLKSTMDLELSPAEGRWRVRLVEKRGGQETSQLTVSKPAAADSGL